MDIKLTSENRGAYMLFINQIKEEADAAAGEWRDFRRCSAQYKICYNGDIILKSYATIVAAIPATNPDTCFDFSRVVYGYTATTSQHIDKFAKMFNATKYIIRG